MSHNNKKKNTPDSSRPIRITLITSANKGTKYWGKNL